ncbi:MAG: hypothetical protein H6662_03405 [Ardenticatenaceae bacterium]|nr:hypothetical protein [Anaerolineales bacterium]MCB8920608.1 hypothetical protein [Ardenticatenaceae bacterium]MCB8990232.1 hypothetical protein [Ardenticatenaceae bacterium]MCB9002976.1 hypothetical protein [Ardenticatenaceae bacterium]
MGRWPHIIGFLLVGIAVGLGLGLYLGWEAWPTEFTDATPEILQDRYRRDYALMIATNYAADGDLASAERRINGLGKDGVANGRAYYFSVTLDTILRNEDVTAITYMVRLATDLGLESPAFAPYLVGGGNAITP